MSRDVVDRFLARYFADEDAERVRTLADYQREFPGSDDALAEAWAALERSAAPPSDGATVGRFRLLRELGRGGQGVVYLAEDPRLDRQVALKVLAGTWTDGMLVRFRREAQLASRLEHEHVCPVHDADVDDGHPWIAMPFLSGDSLAARLAGGEPLPVDDVLVIGEAIARALDAAHGHGVVHRDVKPGNILFAGERPLLTDFGVAREVDGANVTLTATGEIVGTLNYLAPEVIDGDSADPRSDVYALGATLYECLAGEPAFDGPTRGALLRAILGGHAPELRRLNPSLAPDLGVVVATAMARDPRDRYATAAALADDLRRVREKRPIQARVASPWLRLRRWIAREPGLAAAVGGVVATLLVGLVVALLLMQSAQDEREQKETALLEIEALADRTRVEELIAELSTLEPPWPQHEAGLRAWIDRADALAERLPIHRDGLARLRASARPATPVELEAARASDPRRATLAQLERNRDFLAEQQVHDRPEQGVDSTAKQLARVEARIAELGAELDELPTHRFPNAELRWRDGLLVELIATLEAFIDGAPTRPSLARGRELLQRASKLGEQSLRAHAEAWKRCVVEIADREACPHYDGFELTPQVGLVPLGRDPESGLHEFADLLTGDVPVRDANTGRLAVGEATGLVFVLVPGGPFVVGAHDESSDLDEPDAVQTPRIDPRAQPYERPIRVELTPFLIAKYEVSQAQWLRWTGDNPSQTPPGTRYRHAEPTTAMHPVESVSWFVGRDVLQRFGCDLPTSAQWERAARAGSDTIYPGTDDIGLVRQFANLGDLALLKVSGRAPGPDANALGDDGWGIHAPIGSLAPNAFGLHDVIGNVQEWCRDVDYDIDAPWQSGDAERLVGRPNDRVIRGGSYLLGSVYGRSAGRSALRADSRQYDHGLRPIRLLR